MNQAIEQAIIDHTNKVWEQALKVGMADERERIIKLLSDFDNEKYFNWLETADAEWSKDYWEMASGIRLAIELIKGEK
jgi:hypothetical protein